ncbi:NUDIX hydrolase [Paenibacillus yonginensis]|nr:NUDIX domain-containing protein [Paenibacillus yonginensis]
MNGSCVVLLDAYDRLLLQRRKDNALWGLPGGAMEIGESYEDTARRELLEETGLRAGCLSMLGLYSGKDLHFRYPNGDEVFLIFAAYLCTDYEGELQDGADEVLEAGFFELNRLPGAIHPPDWPVIRKLIAEMPK